MIKDLEMEREKTGEERDELISEKLEPWEAVREKQRELVGGCNNVTLHPKMTTEHASSL